MKLKKEEKQAIGLAAVFSAMALAITFLVLAVRKRSITGALLALTTATGSAVGATLLLDAAVAPDPDGENVVVPDGENEGDTELFEQDELEAAEQCLEAAL